LIPTAQQKAAEAQQKAAQAQAKLAAERAGSEEQAAKFISGGTKSGDGIYYKTTRAGSGAKIGKNKQVAAHYKGYFLDNTVFDSSEGREPLSFRTGAGQMISGFDKMAQDMAVGEKRTLVLPPKEAYGSQGAGGVIPPNAYIVFDVEVVSAR
jgi:FKBP-type peptidyl-prolyl cis-trans isomerase